VAISFAGADAAAYSTTANACAGVRLAVGASCSVSVRFVPPTGPGSGMATLTATAGVQQASTPLSGQAFGTLRVNGGVFQVLMEEFPTVTIPIENASLYPAPVAVRLNASPVFVIAANTCGPDPLAPGASCAVELEAVNAPLGMTVGQLVVMNGPVTRTTISVYYTVLGNNL
jgi:hypothetical protein